MLKNAFKLIINLLIMFISIYFLLGMDSTTLFPIYKILLIVLISVLLILSYSLSSLRSKSLSRLFYVLFVLVSLIIIAYALLLKYNVLYVFSSVSTLKEYILSTKEKGILIYILIQVAQVVILPIPAAIICVVGSLIYGPLLGGLYCSIGILVGSFISFAIGRTCGHRIVSWIVGESNCEKYSAIILKRGSFFLGLAFLLPMFPDDILCLIAGITNMPLLSFAWVTILFRPIGVICMSYFGSGKLIPFTGWGVYVWIVILFIAVAMVYVTYRYQDSMQEFILNKVFKKDKPKKNKSK